jgi:uncharacterized membrane protein
MAKIAGALTLFGFVAVVVAITFRYMEVDYPIPIILLGLGAGCFLVAGVPWAHTQGKSRLKVAALGLVGFAVGGVSGFFLGATIGPQRPDDMSGLIFAFAGMWISGILFAFLGVRWAIWFHSRYATEPRR